MTKKFLIRTGLGLFVAASMALAGACSDDETTTTTTNDAGTSDATTGGDGSTPTGPGSLKLNVTYNGNAIGALQAGLFNNFPPNPPRPVGNGVNPNPSFPGTDSVTVSNLNPGTYFVTVYIDVNGDNPMGPGDEDPGVPPPFPPPQVTVEAGKQATLDLTIVDKPPSDGGTDGGDGGDAGDASTD